MEAFLARQPILDKHNKVLAYELLFRNSLSNSYNNKDGDKATIDVINNCFINIGIEKIVGNKKAFINFTEGIMKTDIFNIMSPNKVVVELLETVEPTKEIINSCYKVKKKGFVIALDDFVFDSKYKELLQIADIIKVDFKITKGFERKRIINLVKSKKVKFLAEKVETVEEFREAVNYGYSYFQGYYFSKPLVIREKKIQENKMIYLKILGALNNKNLNLDNIANLIKRDVSLSYKLLKLINSAGFSIKNKVTSLNQAVALLGKEELRRWLYYITLGTVADNKPEVIVTDSLIRARFCELIAIKMERRSYAFNAYLTGMLSMIDTILGKSKEEVIYELFVPTDVRNALLSLEKNLYYKILNLVISYEQGEWNEVRTLSRELKLNDKYISEAYLGALEWIKGN